MNRIILGLLFVILGLNIYDLFLKEHFNFTFEAPLLKDSTSCVNLKERETLTCLEEVIAAGTMTGDDLFILGQMYLHGIGADSDNPKAIRLLERSAIEFENVEAMVLLGDLAMSEDLLSAQYWYTKAAKKEYLAGQLKLANIYRYGIEKVQNPEEALELYRAAANQGSLVAQYELALMYAMGLGIEPNLDRSLFMLEAPCSRGHEQSCILLEQIQGLKLQP